MGQQPEKSEKHAKLSRKELDRIEVELIKRPFERREFAGDPRQPRHLWVWLKRNRKKA